MIYVNRISITYETYILDMDSAKAATSAFITSPLYYGNLLLYGLPPPQKKELSKFHLPEMRLLEY